MLSVREISETDVDLLCDYWLNSDSAFLKSMGADKSKLPDRFSFFEMLKSQIGAAYADKKSYCIIWLNDEMPVGHSNVNPINYGVNAFMHLHLWKNDQRNKGFGVKFLKMTLPYFFDRLKLKEIFCQPYAFNEAPNRTLEKVGFEFVKEYMTIPGSINFEQQVKLWVLTRDKFLQIQNHSAS
jgi:RimJ/RimL family protein N-acetyltransferase